MTDDELRAAFCKYTGISELFFREYGRLYAREWGAFKAGYELVGVVLKKEAEKPTKGS